MTKKVDLMGKTFGKLLVLSDAGRDKYGGVLWECKCFCGNLAVVRRGDLKTGAIRSCGCLHKEVMIKSLTTHGLSKHPLFSVWSTMKDRCHNDKCKKYDSYGGRGIKVCDKWRNSFESFYEDVIYGYEKGLKLDRINNNGNYEPDNVRWVTRSQNVANTRSRKNSSSKYKGVCWNKATGKWQASITKEGVRKYLGVFIDEDSAARAYNNAAKDLFGEYASLNVIKLDEKDLLNFEVIEGDVHVSL